MEKYSIEKDGKRSFTIAYFIHKYFAMYFDAGPPLDSEIIQIGNTKPQRVGLTVWHNDGKGDLANHNEAPSL